MNFEATLIWVVVLFTAAAAMTDIWQRRIPNSLTVTTALLAFSYYWLTASWAGLWFSIQGCALGFGVLFVLWLVGGGGGGDVKLMAATGALFGPKLTLIVFFTSVLIAVAGITTITLWTLCRSGIKTFRKDRESRERRSIPYAVPTAFACWLVMAWQIVVH